MKTTINKKLETIEDAVIFIQELVRNDEQWHMDDDASDCHYGEDSETIELLTLRQCEVWDIAYRSNTFCPHEAMYEALNKRFPNIWT